MSKQGKIWIVCILGLILIVALGFYSSRSRRNKEDVTSTDGFETSASVSMEEYQKEQDTIMEEMMEDMMDVPKSGNAAEDFLNGMIPHHQSAVAMSESFLKHGGQNEELKKLANDIITQQNQEIETMKSMVETLREEGVRDEEAEAGYQDAFDKLMENEHTGMNHSMSSNIDRAFAEGMIMHHQMAVDMSVIILNFTDNEEVKQLAEGIIDLQKQEIAQMNAIIESMTEQNH